MTATKYKQILAQIPTPVLLKAARERNRILRQTQGLWAAQKKFSPCPLCRESFGVREMRAHRRHCTGKKKAA